VAFISISEHERFLRLFHLSVKTHENHHVSAGDETVENIMDDIGKLQHILSEYKGTVSQLEELSGQYKVIMQRAKANLRKRQANLTRKQSKLFKSRG
jgi:hypothetical protein